MGEPIESPRGGGRLLLVDDDPALRRAAAHVLRKAGHEVVEVDGGAKALEAALGSRFDLVISDVEMPEMDGLELCRRIKGTAELAGMFVVLLSSRRVASGEQADGLEVGADAYIARPVGNRELLARVAALLRIKRAEEERDRVIQQLREALAKVKTLSGIIPICMHCHKIRDDDGFWNRVESFVSRHTQAEFSHGLCPACLEEHYPEDES